MKSRLFQDVESAELKDVIQKVGARFNLSTVGQEIPMPTIDLLVQDRRSEKLSIEDIRAKIKAICGDHITSDLEKIFLLKRIDTDYCGPLVRRYTYKNSQEDLGKLFLVFDVIGDILKIVGNLSVSAYDHIDNFDLHTEYGFQSYSEETYLEVKSKNSPLRYYTEALIYYRYCLSIINEVLKDEQWQAVQQKVLDIWHSIIGVIKHKQDNQPIKTVEEIELETRANKQILLDLRSDAENRVAEIDKLDFSSKQYVDQSEALFHDIASEIKAFLAKLFHDAELEIGAAPCEYAVIGLGSLALEQATPFSDLEFAILTENRDYIFDADPKVRDYFRNLTYLVHFKVINLGETTIPKSRYGVDLDSMFKPAIMFDLGGKTALGREDKSYDLIQTVDGMMSYVKNFGARIEHLDKNLPNILMQTCYIYGDKDLAKTYKREVLEFLISGNDDHFIQHEVRAIKLLKEGAVELDYSKFRGEITQIHGDMDKLSPLEVNINGKLFDVKQEIYRLPDRLIYNLGLFYNIVGNSIWDIVDGLGQKKVINHDATFNLKCASTFAMLTRLRTYISNGGQIENLSLFSEDSDSENPISTTTNKAFRLCEEDLLETGKLFKFYYIAIPLYEKLYDFCQSYDAGMKSQKHEFCFDGSMYKDDALSKGLIHYRLMHYEEAGTHLECSLRNATGRDVRFIIGLLGKIHLDTGNVEKSDNYFQMLLGDEEQNNFRDLQRYLVFLSTSLMSSGRYDDAEQCFKLGLLNSDEASRLDFGSNFSALWVGLGNLSFFREKYDDAMICYKNALKLKIELHNGDFFHADIANVLSNIALIYQARGLYEEAVKNHKKSLYIKQKIYQFEPHPDTQQSLNNLGVLYKLKCDPEIAQRYYKASLAMLEFFDHGESLERAKILGNIANCFLMQNKCQEAINMHLESLHMRERLHSKNPEHPDISDSLYNLGVAYSSLLDFMDDDELRMKAYEEAQKYIRQSLNMREKNSFTPKQDIADSYMNLGLLLERFECYQEAMDNLKTSLDIRRGVKGLEHHQSIIYILKRLAILNYRLNEHDLAFSCLHDSLDLLKVLYEQKSGYDKHNIALGIIEVSMTIKFLLPDRYEACNSVDQFFNQLLSDLGFYYSFAVSTDNHSFENAVTVYSFSGSKIFDLSASEFKEIDKYLIKLIFTPKDEEVEVQKIEGELNRLGINHNEIALWLAVSSGDVDSLNSLRDSGVDLNYVSFMMFSPLIQAIRNGHEKVVEILILSGVDVNLATQDSYSYSPLHCAVGALCQEVNNKIVGLLLNHGVNIEQVAHQGLRAMHMAHYFGNLEAIRLLYNRGAKLNVFDDDGDAPIDSLMQNTAIPNSIKLSIISEFLSKYDAAKLASYPEFTQILEDVDSSANYVDEIGVSGQISTGLGDLE